MSAALFAPITLRGLTARNRLWVPPMCQYMVESRDGVAGDWHLVHYGALARGGAGALIVEATGVLPEGRITPQDLGLWNDTQRDALRRVTAFAHTQGATIGIQLAHAGRKASTYREWGVPRSGSLPADEAWTTVAPSPVAFSGYAQPVALDRTGIDQVVTAFAASARRAVDAGFDFVEVHAAHGYLIHEFLSPLSNLRDDEYGGSLENRARLLLRIVDAVRATLPDPTPLVVRLSATDWTAGGVTVEETAQLVSWIGEHGVDLADISSGGNVRATIPIGPGYQVPLATSVSRATGIPVAAVGMIDDPWQAEQIVATGLADVVLTGREALRNPAFALRAAWELGVDLPYVPEPYQRAYRQAQRRR